MSLSGTLVAMARKPSSALILWCAPALFLAAVLLGAWIVLARPPLLGVLLVLVVVLPAAWVLVSSLWPARAQRTCPACGADALVRADPRATHGLACTGCGWRDESASAWLLAEEEGPLEEIVLAERRARAAARVRVREVDSPRRGG